MQRRNFIKSSCTFCIGATVLGTAVTELSSCASLPIYKGNTDQGFMNIPLSALEDKNMLIVRNADMEYDILLVKKSATDISALLMKCTHQNNPLIANNTGLFCPSHGSAFDLEGNVTQDPALVSLKKYKAEIINETVIINLK